MFQNVLPSCISFHYAHYSFVSRPGLLHLLCLIVVVILGLVWMQHEVQWKCPDALIYALMYYLVMLNRPWIQSLFVNIWSKSKVSSGALSFNTLICENKCQRYGFTIIQRNEEVVANNFCKSFRYFPVCKVKCSFIITNSSFKLDFKLLIILLLVI